jgi:hypothetical protein
MVVNQSKKVKVKALSKAKHRDILSMVLKFKRDMLSMIGLSIGFCRASESLATNEMAIGRSECSRVVHIDAAIVHGK